MRATIRGDATRFRSALSQRIYGQNLEVMGRQFLGGMIPEQGSTAPSNETGLRLDVREAIKELGIRHLRWPGGCFADCYSWRQGIGSDRSHSRNRPWGNPLIGLFFAAMGVRGVKVGPDVDNRFGTNEFIAYCRAVGAEPSITASMGDRGPEEAEAWVAYVRDEFGSGAVPVWFVGNEQWNPIEHNGCFRRPRRYVERYLRWAEAMRRADPRIRLVASGGDDLAQPEWNSVLLEGIGEEMDYISCHIYAPIALLSRGLTDDEATYLAMSGAYLYVEKSFARLTRKMQSIIGREIPIAFDEWNVLGAGRNFVMPQGYLREAIAAAGIVHAIHRHSHVVTLADQFAAINAAAPPIITDRDRLTKTPMYHVLQTYSLFSRNNVAEVETDSPGFSTIAVANLPAQTEVPFLDASLTSDDTGTTLFMINRHPREPLGVEIEVEGIAARSDALLRTITGPSFLASNPIGGPEAVAAEDEQLIWPERIVLPACSLSALVQRETSGENSGDLIWASKKD